MIRFFVDHTKWVERNWRLFANDWGDYERRDVHLFFPFDKASLAELVRPWWDPDVLTNASIASSPRTIAEIHKRLEPGVLCFSVALSRLSSCEIYFHPKDLEAGVITVCESANKTKQWFVPYEP